MGWKGAVLPPGAVLGEAPACELPAYRVPAGMRVAVHGQGRRGRQMSDLQEVGEGSQGRREIGAGASGPGQRHRVVWDGECGFCRRCVGWIRARDRDGLFETVPYQELPSPPMTPELEAACADAVHVLAADGARLRAGRAVLFVTERLGWRWTSRLLRLPPMVWLVEIAYRLVARNRRLVSRLLPAERR